MNFNDFAQKHYNAAFGLKCFAAVAMVALVASLLTPLSALLLVASTLSVAKDMFRDWKAERMEAKSNMSKGFDNFEPSTPRMGSR